jgi:hypothetical protein
MHVLFKPDKKLKRLLHLGTVQLELQLEDRVVDVDVPPLEAASYFQTKIHARSFPVPLLFSFLDFFSRRLDFRKSHTSVGSIDRGAVSRLYLLGWIMEFKKKTLKNTLILLEKAEGGSDAGMIGRRLVLFFLKCCLRASSMLIIIYLQYRIRISSNFYYVTTKGRANASQLESRYIAFHHLA